MKKNEMKTCEKCGEKYFGEECVGCYSNQYAHYTKDAPTKIKIYIAVALLVVAGIIVATQMQHKSAHAVPTTISYG